MSKMAVSSPMILLHLEYIKLLTLHIPNMIRNKQIILT